MEPGSIEFLISGIIMMAVIGPAIGNYVTSVVYRLPFGQTPFEKSPYCGDCGNMLQPKDLFPIFSYLSTMGKCRYCGVNIRPSYTWIEVACGVVFITNFVLLGISEHFILVTALATFLVMLAGLEYHEHKIFSLVFTYCLGIAMVQRVLGDGSIYPMIQSGFLCFFAAVVIWRLLHKTQGVPAYVWMMSLLGIVFPIGTLMVPLLVSAATYMLTRFAFGWRAVSPAFAVGIWIGLLTV